MRIFKTLLAFTFTLTTSQIHAAKTEDPNHKIMVNTAAYLSSLKSIGHMVNLLKGAAANEEDKKYLNSLTKEELSQPMPEVTADVKKKMIYIKGLQPIEVVDLAKGKFMFQGREFIFEPSMTIERAIVKLEELIYPKKNAWLELLLPSANAAITAQNKGLLMGVFGAMGIMGMLACLSQQGGGQQGQQQQQQQRNQQAPGLAAMGGGNGACMMGLAGLLGLFVAMGMKEQPKEVKCTTTMDGMRTAQIIGPNGQILSSTQGLPGQYVTNPPVALPLAGPPMGVQMMQMCDNRPALMNLNQALAAPIVLPPTNQMRAYVNAPAQFPAGGTAVRSLQPQSREPAQSGDARFLDPGSGAR